MRYDLTAPLARYVAENFQNLAMPYRSYRYGWVFRNEKPGPGRYRQFMQFDADTVGAASMAADAEMCMLAADTMEALGIPRGSYVVKVNNRKILDGAMDALEIPAEKRLTTCGPSISWIGSASKASECFSAKAARMKVATSQRSRADGFPNCGHRGSDWGGAPKTAAPTTQVNKAFGNCRSGASCRI